MSKWIEADAFLKEYCEPYPHIYKAMSRAMADAPSIDIVRCGECKRCTCDIRVAQGSDGSFIEVNECNITRPPTRVDKNHFCGYGERKESK